MDMRLTKKQVEKLNNFYSKHGLAPVSGPVWVYPGDDNWDQQGSAQNWSDLKLIELIEMDRLGFARQISDWIRDQDDFVGDEMVYVRHFKADREGLFHLSGSCDEKDTSHVDWRTSLEFYEMKPMTVIEAIDQNLLPDWECFEEFYILINA